VTRGRRFLIIHRGHVVVYAATCKVAGSIPDKVTGFFNLSISSSRIMALGSNQPLTEMSTTNLPGGKGRPECKAICEPIV
jgi:hypothetical protein